MVIGRIILISCSKELQPELVKASADLLREHIRIAKVDATTEKKLAVRFQIKSYPTLLFFRSGKESKFDGRRSHLDIVEWLK